MALTKLALTAHRWIGLVAGLTLLAQGLTGLGLVFREDINAVLQPHAFTVARYEGAYDLDRALAIAKARHPDLKLARVDIPAHRDRPIIVRFGSDPEVLVSIDPATGDVLADGSRMAFPAQWLYEAHVHFLSGEGGKWVIAFNATALILMSLSGPIAWWPGRSRLKKALAPPATKGPFFRVVANLHRFAGIYLCLLLFTVGCTGLTLVFFEDLQKQVATVLPTKAAPKLPKGPAPAAFTPLNTLVATARAEAPGRPLKSLRFSGKDRRFMSAVFRSETGHALRIDQVWIDRAGGAVLGKLKADDSPPGTRLLSWVLPLHAGDIYGPFGKAVGLVSAIALISFLLSGIWLYVRRLMPQRRPEPRVRQA
jgi:uncharacterized iron-regulated membrane protein